MWLLIILTYYFQLINSQLPCDPKDLCTEDITIAFDTNKPEIKLYPFVGISEYLYV